MTRHITTRALISLSLLATLALISPGTLASATQVPAGNNSGAASSSSSVIHIKFEKSAVVSLANGKFISKSGKDLGKANTLASTNNVKNKERLFQGNADKIESQRKALEQKSKTSLPDLNSYFELKLQPGRNIHDVLAQLKSAPYIVEAYAAPLPVQSPLSPDFTSKQMHFKTVPDGMNLKLGGLYPGGRGEAVRIADIEYDWNRDHEDIEAARASDALIPNGTFSSPYSNAHGTAVAGILSGQTNSYGINGIAPDSKLHLVNAYNIERGWDIANAVYISQDYMESGDIILIEQQAQGPSEAGKYVPVEWIPSVYDAIRIATAKGVHVIEAAGNGGENLDDPIYGSSFPQGKPDSGAIIVGAGSFCQNTVHKERLSFSTYGSRVNVQGPGNCVVTSGYGGLYSADGPNSFYTGGFSGTSSASAIVAGAAAVVASSYETQTGAILTPIELRQLLVDTGSPQSPTGLTGNIGPRPDVKSALDSFSAISHSDTAAPTAPSNLTTSAIEHTSAVINWSASTDDYSTFTYDIYRNGSLRTSIPGSTPDLKFTDTGLSPGTEYTYHIQARDSQGNTSAPSDTVIVQTPEIPDTTAPSAPSNLTASAVSSQQVNLSWTGSYDAIGVVGYEVYRNNVRIASTSTRSYTDSGLTQLTTYSYYIRAYDAAGNTSAPSGTITVQTPEMPDTTAPSVSFLSPAHNATVSSSMVIKVAASDNKNIAKIELYIDGKMVSSNTGLTTLSYTWNSKKASRGAHTLTAKAYDTSGNTSQTSITVYK